MLTISSGYDPGYLTRAVATGRENYYLSAVAEHGEPPGIWTGRGCPELGLRTGSEVDGRVMERLYGAFLDPRDPSGQMTLGRAPSGFAGNSDKVAALIAARLAAEPGAAPERRDQIIMQALKDQRAAVYFFDATFSVPKSVSLLHASFQVKAEQARDAGDEQDAAVWEDRAQDVWDSVMAGNEAMLAYLQREAGYSRAGYHSRGSGRFVDAHDWVIASFRQHTSRDNDPQLHVHNAILNRVLREDPLASRPGDRWAWRTLDGASLYAVKPAAAAIAERTLAEQLTARLGVEIIARPDGNGWEVAGIPGELRERFSSRRRVIEPRVHELVTEYERKHGRAPNARAVWSMAQFVTLDSRQPKAHEAPSRQVLLARWEAESREAESTALSEVAGAALGRHERGDGLRQPFGGEIERVLVAAIADAQQRKATFSRYELMRMISRHLPDSLGGLPGGQVTRLLEDLTGQALRPGGSAGTIQVSAPEMVAVPQAFRRADGLSWWRRHGAEIYTTRATLDTETRLLRAAAQAGAPAVEPDRAAAALGADRARIETRLWREHGHPGAEPGPDAGAGGAAGSAAGSAPGAEGGAQAPLSCAGLVDDQVQAAYGVLTSGRAIDILVGPAGAGKTRTVARLAHVWREAGAGRVIGLTTSTNAAHTLAGEGLADSHNLAVFLGRVPGSTQTRGHLPVHAGDLLIVDEASMVSTADLAAVEEIATRCGAKILLTGDPEQLAAPEAGGAMRLLAGEHGYYQLTTVLRFEEAWEREASQRLRTGDADVLAEYDQRGRILDGTREEMSAAACRRWLADHLTGLQSVLVATTNTQAAELARRARDELAALGLVAAGDVTELADGNVAGPGDLIVARQNARIQAGRPGRRLANRDVLRIEAWEEAGEERAAVVRRMLGGDRFARETRWSDPFRLPETYIEQHADLAYVGTVHVAQGRTVDAAHLVVDETAGRQALYVGMSRGRERNTAYVVTERARAADLSPDLRPAPELEDPGAGVGAAGRPHRFAVLAGVLEREQNDLTATETIRRELDRSASLTALAPMWADVTRTHTTREHERVIRSLLTPAEWERFGQDPERGTLARLLRAADLAGHDVPGVLHRAVEGRDFTGARSIAAVLHARVQQITGTPEPLAAATYTQRTPPIQDRDAERLARDIAAAMDQRVGVLGERAVADRPVWALRYLGEVPTDPGARAEWAERAGIVAAYREERGYTHETEAIGPAPERASPEQRASWHAAYVALRMPDAAREVAAASDGELWARRATYERDVKWAPPYVAGELREAHLAEDTYRAEAVRAWYRGDAAAGEEERARAWQEAEGHSVLAQEVVAYREALTEVDQARRKWHEATEEDRRRALMADSELRRRYPELEVPPLHPEEEQERPEVNAESVRKESDAVAESQVARDEVGVEQAEADGEAGPGRAGWELADIESALEAARQAERILAEREQRAGRAAERDGDDVMRRREAQAQQEADARRSAVRQEPLPSHREQALEWDEPELGA